MTTEDDRTDALRAGHRAPPDGHAPRPAQSQQSQPPSAWHLSRTAQATPKAPPPRTLHRRRWNGSNSRLSYSLKPATAGDSLIANRGSASPPRGPMQPTPGSPPFHPPAGHTHQAPGRRIRRFLLGSSNSQDLEQSTSRTAKTVERSGAFSMIDERRRRGATATNVACASTVSWRHGVRASRGLEFTRGEHDFIIGVRSVVLLRGAESQRHGWIDPLPLEAG